MASAISALRSSMSRSNGLFTPRQARLTTLLVYLFHSCVPVVKAFPLVKRTVNVLGAPLPKSPHNPDLWIYLGIAIALVLAGGVFAGLTIAYVLLLSTSDIF
jgi:metal transporter CNNM